MATNSFFHAYRLSQNAPTKCTPTKDKLESSTDEKVETYGNKIIRQGLQKLSVSGKAANIIMASWRTKTKSQYATYIKKWTIFCNERKVNPFEENITVFLDFLTELFESNLSYSVINTARSAVSSIVVCENRNQSIGSHYLVSRLLKGCYELRPPTPRYKEIWDVSPMLQYLKTLSPVRAISLKNLSFKLVSLIALTTACRGDTLHQLNLEHMKTGKSPYSFSVKMKQSKQSLVAPLVILSAYPADRRLCVVMVMQEYLRRTQDLRKSQKQLFISYLKPHQAVTKSTIARWIKTTMISSGINTNHFKPHSTCAAASSKAITSIPLDHILNTVGWTQESTFSKFYKKTIVKSSRFAESILS